MVRKTIRVATKVKDPETFAQKYKTTDGTWVQSFGKQPRLLRNCGVAFVPNPLIYGPCRPSRFSDYVAYKSARISRPCLRFLDIEDPNAPHTMFRGYGNRTNQENDEKGTCSRQSRTKQWTKWPSHTTGQTSWTKNGRTPL